MKKRTKKEAAPKLKRKLPFAFVLEELAPLEPYTRQMFGCTAIYVGEKIVFILRERKEHPADNGVWIATTAEHHASLQREFPSMRSILLFETEGPTGWQNLPAESDEFEDSVLKACTLVKRKDPRIGKVPASRAKKGRTKTREKGKGPRKK